MTDAPERFAFDADGGIPNSRLPLLVWRGALPAEAAAMERAFARHDWRNSWRDGIYRFHHFHSIAHEVLGIAAGEGRVTFGGPHGRTLVLRAGDVVAIPAGVGHCNAGSGADFLVVGAYPGGADWDVCRADPAALDRVRAAIAAVPVPAQDPVSGGEGTLRRLWTP